MKDYEVNISKLNAAEYAELREIVAEINAAIGKDAIQMTIAHHELSTIAYTSAMGVEMHNAIKENKISLTSVKRMGEIVDGLKK